MPRPIRGQYLTTGEIRVYLLNRVGPKALTVSVYVNLQTRDRVNMFPLLGQERAGLITIDFALCSPNFQQMKYWLISFLGMLTLIGCIQPGGTHVHGDWGTDLPTALAKAKEDGKLVLLDFTGSDWCPPCRMLHDKVLSTQPFVDYAKDKLVLVELDFPREKKQAPALAEANDALSKQFEIEGFPTLILLDNNGKELAREVGLAHESPEEIIAWLDKFKASQPTGNDANGTSPDSK